MVAWSEGGFHVFGFLKLKIELSFKCQIGFWKYLGIIELLEISYKGMIFEG